MPPDLDQIYAEAIAWPLRDPTTFTNPTALTHAHLRLGFEARARQRGQNHNASLIAARAWQNRNRIDIPTLLAEEAQRRLLPEAQGFSLQVDPQQPGREVLAWRWLSLALPIGLLTAAATPRGRRPSLHVQLLRPHEAPPGPIAHQHVHAGATWAFEVIWARLATRLPHATIAKDKRPEVPAHWPTLLVQAMVARRYLAQTHGLCSFNKTPNSHTQLLLDQSLAALAQGEAHPFKPIDLQRLITWATARLRRASRGDTPAQVWADDPIGDGDDWPEGRLIQSGLWGSWPAADRDLLLQVLRVKLMLFDLLVTQPSDEGLTTFVRTYDAIAHYRCDLRNDGFGHAQDEPELPSLGSVELRTAPATTIAENLDLIAPRSPDPAQTPREWGWVLHFIRSRKTRTDQDGAPGQTWRELARDHRRRARTLARTLERYPAALIALRGLDLCKDESQGPYWLVAGHLRALRAASREAAQQAGIPGLRPFCVTLHAGEDFAHLLTGLRNIIEPIHHGVLTAGDRLGHAIALGHDPARWCQTHPRAVLPRLSRLLDLDFALKLAEDHPDALPISGGLLLRWQRERQQRRTEIWPGEPPDDLSLLTDLDVQMAAGIYRAVPPSPSPHPWLTRLLFDPIVGAAAVGAVEVDVAAEAPAIVHLHEACRAQVARLGIAVELNPSSNLVVAGLDHALAQPAFGLQPLLRSDRNPIPIPISLNADDPLIFTTRLADELAYARAGLVAGAGLSPVDVDDWISRAAATSWRYRFTLPASRSLHLLPAPPVGRRWGPR